MNKCPICGKPMNLYFCGCISPYWHLQMAIGRSMRKLIASFKFLIYSIKELIK